MSDQPFSSKAQTRSFRDPAGCVTITQDAVYRAIFSEGMACWTRYVQSPVLERFRQEGRLIGFDSVKPEQEESKALWGAEERKPEKLVKHKKICFPNYPQEWAAPMLAEAGFLTLDLAEAVLPEGLRLKDATPFNIMFEGPNPIFLDALSFEPFRPESALWLAESQFLRTFYYPLLLWQKAKLPLANIFLSCREGISSEQALGVLGFFERWRPRYLLSVTLAALVDRRAKASWMQKEICAAHEQTKAPAVGQAILEALFKRLRGFLLGANKEKKTSHWARYDQRKHYADEATRTKRTLVEKHLEKAAPSHALDIGCNLGEFTRLAARHGKVTAIDSDPDVVGSLWRAARTERLPILPLVQNIASPTPATGWMNAETPSFLDRARGAFDCVMMLAVLHHLLVTERLPLEEIIDLAASLTTGFLIIEYVDPQDHMFKTIARGREKLHVGLNEAAFETTLSARFDIIEKTALPGLPRTLYFAKKK